MIAEIDKEQLEQTLTDYANQPTLTREDVDAILLDYGNYIGVDELVLDENNTTALTIEDEVEIALVHLPHFSGIVAVAEIDPEVREHPPLLKRMLQANMSWELTHGGCFAVIPPAKQLVLCRLIGLLDRDLQRIDRELAAFVQLVEAWQQELEMGLLIDDEAETTEEQFRPGYLRP